jgi:hypothetical protein
MEASKFPEPEVAAFVASHDLRGRMLTWFDWGEYAIWHFSPAITVSFDGRRETVYSEAAIQQQLTLYSRPAERKAVIDALQPAFIWLPSNLAITADLIADGWKPMLSGSRSTLLGRENRGAPAIVHAVDTARCFPGP